MKILHIIPTYKPAYKYGGPIESVARLCEGLAEAGHAVHVFTTTANGDQELDVDPGREIDVQGVKVIYFKSFTKEPTYVSPALWKRLWGKVRDFDIIHIHSWWNILVVIAAWICIIKRMRIIISPRGMLSEYIISNGHSEMKKWIHKLLGKRALKKSILHATAISEYDECAELVKGWKGFVLPNILLLSEIEVEKIVNKSFTLIFLSRIHPKKGLELLFRALVDLPFNVKLNIAGIGDEDYILKLKQYAKTLGIENKIGWLGWRDREEKYVELMRSDCFILTSHNENFANVVIESLHVGTPVIISEEVGLAPFVLDKNLGWVTSMNEASVRAAIIEAYNDRDKRYFINKNARSIISETFLQRTLINQYVENYVAANAAVVM